VNSFVLIIIASAVVVLSYFFNIVAKRTNIPSVIMLIGLGILMEQTQYIFHYKVPNLTSVLEILGNVGLILIVLEAALDLELSRKKRGIILKALLCATIALFAGAFVIAFLIQQYTHASATDALIYAIPLSIISSAIVIPSVGVLTPVKKEFMVYESTFSDILGIMFFYFLIGNIDAPSAQDVVFDITGNIIITVILSVVFGYGLVFIFQKIKTEVKLFLLTAVLTMLYAIGKYFHLSSLIMILIFGVIINNHQLFFKGFLRKYINTPAINEMLHNFHLITIESAFVVRTFFFVIFGLSISITSLYNIEYAIVSAVLIASIYLVRFVTLKVVAGHHSESLVMLAPRGLITILLYYAIPQKHAIAAFDESILLFVILASSVLMSISLLGYDKDKEVKKNAARKAAQMLLRKTDNDVKG
jgi:Kef-type K+ transport system membrane component KefB